MVAAFLKDGARTDTSNQASRLHFVAEANAVESLNSVIRSATIRRKVFPSDDSVIKAVYLAVEQASQK